MDVTHDSLHQLTAVVGAYRMLRNLPGPLPTSDQVASVIQEWDDYDGADEPIEFVPETTPPRPEVALVPIRHLPSRA